MIDNRTQVFDVATKNARTIEACVDRLGSARPRLRAWSKLRKSSGTSLIHGTAGNTHLRNGFTDAF
jgi:hypothetical protein